MLLLGNYRLLLRREQVHKVACNHLLTAEIQLQPMQTSETAWCWFAMDYSEDEPAMQNFACRFKVFIYYEYRTKYTHTSTHKKKKKIMKYIKTQ